MKVRVSEQQAPALQKVTQQLLFQLLKRQKAEINKLKQIVNETMPTLKAKYEAELGQFEQYQLVQQVIGGAETRTAPRKKFHWNDASRGVLIDLFRSIKDIYKVQRSKKETEDAFINRCLQEHVVPLWPAGGIKTSDLITE